MRKTDGGPNSAKRNAFIRLVLIESLSQRRHLLARLLRSLLKKARWPRRSPWLQLHRRWQSASAETMAARVRRIPSRSLPSTFSVASPWPRRTPPHLPTPLGQQECYWLSRRFQQPTPRSRAPPRSVQSLSFRNAPFPRESAPPIRW